MGGYREIFQASVTEPAAYERVCEAFFERRFGDVRVYDDVRPALARLAATPLPGAPSVTNASTEPARGPIIDRG